MSSGSQRASAATLLTSYDMGACMDVHQHGLSQRFSKWLMLVCGAMRLVIDVLSGVGGYLLVGAGCIGPRELI